MSKNQPTSSSSSLLSTSPLPPQQQQQQQQHHSPISTSASNVKCKNCTNNNNNSNSKINEETLTSSSDCFNNMSYNKNVNNNLSASSNSICQEGSINHPNQNIHSNSGVICLNASSSPINEQQRNLKVFDLLNKNALIGSSKFLSPNGFQIDATNSANFLNRNSCIIERLSFLYLNESLADVYFILNKTADTKERIPAHKLILAIGSQVFMAMFYGSGSQMMQTNEIHIPDVEIDSFKHMLRYLYTDELYIEADTVMSTLYCAKKYSITHLEQECVDFLKINLKSDNAFMLLQQARLFDETHLAELCLNLIDKNSCEAFASDYFLDIDLDTLILILKRDTLGIREFKLYYYIIKWAKNQCIKKGLLPITRETQQTVLGEAVKHIRFPLMNREEFAIAMNDPDTRVIDDESIIELFVNLTLINSNLTMSGSLGDSSGNNSICKKLKFNDTPRCCLGGKEQVINRFCQVESKWGYSGTSDRVRFSVNKRIFVIGFGLYGSIYGKCEYQVTIQLIHYDSCSTQAQNSTTFICDGTNSTFRVLFKEPVEIGPDTDYIAAASLIGPDSFYGTKGLRKVNHESISAGKLTFQFQYASGNNNGTSVEDGQIPEIIFLYSCS